LAEARLARQEQKLQKLAEKQLLADTKLARQRQGRSPQKSVRFEADVQPYSSQEDPGVPEPGPSRSRAQRRLPQRYRN
jgi:CO/xanthine dehydrogenase Mo-binding subunit